MRKIGLLIMIYLLSTVCTESVSAEVFFWEDKKGVQMTHDVSKLPQKFRDKYEKFIKLQPKQDPPKTEKVIPESAKNAVKALKKLEARCQAGISYRDYSPALGEAKFETNMFLQSKDAEDFKELRSSISKAVGHYEYANVIWQYKFLLNKDLFELDSDFSKSFLKAYPEANKQDSEGGVITTSKYDNKEWVFFSLVISHVFSAGSKELANAFAMLSSK